jgi:myosin heavy subunit
VDDARDFEHVRNALVVLGFEQKEIVSVWRVVAAILHLGNVEFTAGERTKVVNTDVLARAAKLFGVEPVALSKGLSNRGFQGGNRKSGYAIPLTGAEAAAARDGFAKAIYAMLFDWLVSRINERIKPEKQVTKRRGGGGCRLSWSLLNALVFRKLVSLVYLIYLDSSHLRITLWSNC